MGKLRLETPIVRVRDQVSTEIDGEVIILAVSAGEYYGLEAVGARIWDMLPEPKTVKGVLEALLAEYDVGAWRAERDLLGFLEQLVDEGLVEVSVAATS